MNQHQLLIRLLCVTVVFIGCTYLHSIEWMTVTQEDRVITLTTTGVVDSEDSFAVGPPPTTRWRASIAQIVEEGKRISKGELLVRFEGSRADERIRELESRIEELEGTMESDKEKLLQELEQEKLDLANLESNADRAARKAAVPAGVIPGIDYQKLLEEKRLSKILYDRAIHRKTLNDQAREATKIWQEKNLERTKARLAGSRDILSSYTVRSPREGISVIGTDWDGQKLIEGSNVSVGFTVVRVVDDTKLLIKADVPENVAAQINTGQSVTILTEATGTSELTGTVFSVGNTVRRKSKNSLAMVRDFAVKLDGDYSDVLKVGVSVQLTVRTETITNVVAIPKEALVYRDGYPGVIKPTEGITAVFNQGEWSPVYLGKSSDDFFVVLDGLEVGDKVRL